MKNLKIAIYIIIFGVLSLLAVISQLPPKEQIQEVSVRPGIHLLIRDGCGENQLVRLMPSPDKKSIIMDCIDKPNFPQIGQNLQNSNEKNGWIIGKR